MHQPADSIDATARTARGRLGALLIKPSRYDEEGYVIQWWRSFIVANVLAVVAGIVKDAAARQCLGTSVAIEQRTIDEAGEVIRPARQIEWLSQFDRAAVFMVGVQTSQFPRALDLSKTFVDAGYPVIVGGFHVSGHLSMTPNWEPGLAGVKEARVSLYAGELENGIDDLLGDIWNNEVKPLYRRLAPLADLTMAPAPTIQPELAQRTLENIYGMEVSRGCPFVCSFCSIINVHGRKMRHRSPEQIERYLRDCAVAGGRSLVITDDNFVRNPIWREVTAAMARVAAEMDIEWNVFIEVDALAVRVDGFVEACRNAGVRRVFIGLESVRADNIAAASKGQNKIRQMRDMVMAWKQAGIAVLAGYIVGFPNDTPERLAEDIRQLQEVVPVDYVEFFILAPQIGSQDHKTAVEAGVDLDRDLNRYATSCTVTDHPTMSRRELERLYFECWRRFYSREHLTVTIARAIYYDLPVKDLRTTFVCTRTICEIEKIHPLESGAIRIRDRLSRRPGFKREARVPFALKTLAHTATMLSVTAAALLYAYGVELWLRFEDSRGRLERYIGDLPRRHDETPARTPFAAAE